MCLFVCVKEKELLSSVAVDLYANRVEARRVVLLFYCPTKNDLSV